MSNLKHDHSTHGLQAVALGHKMWTPVADTSGGGKMVSGEEEEEVQVVVNCEAEQVGVDGQKNLWIGNECGGMEMMW